jgi:hypothetical protein
MTSRGCCTHQRVASSQYVSRSETTRSQTCHSSSRSSAKLGQYNRTSTSPLPLHSLSPPFFFVACSWAYYSEISIFTFRFHRTLHKSLTQHFLKHIFEQTIVSFHRYCVFQITVTCKSVKRVFARKPNTRNSFYYTNLKAFIEKLSHSFASPLLSLSLSSLSITLFRIIHLFELVTLLC